MVKYFESFEEKTGIIATTRLKLHKKEILITDDYISILVFISVIIYIIVLIDVVIICKKYSPVFYLFLLIREKKSKRNSFLKRRKISIKKHGNIINSEIKIARKQRKKNSIQFILTSEDNLQERGICHTWCDST